MSLAQPQTNEHTIAALSTPPGVGAIAVVRLSGPNARAIAGRVFSGTEDLTKASPRTACHGFAVNESGECLDEVLATVFSAPHSYTGEDMVELSCHGGPLPSALVLDAVIRAGACPAAPGEFTKRAFLNGKLDLSQAEAIAEVIGARSRAGLKAALSQLGGSLSERVRRTREKLIAVLAELEARLDFSEDVDEPLGVDATGRVIGSAAEDLRRLLDGASLGRLAREGARVVIAGRPNVGKSSLLNAMVGRDRAIVTTVPGTTRDAIEEWVEVGGILLTLADTAGLRSAGDEIEAEGVRRTRSLIRESRLVLAVMEMQTTPGEETVRLVAELAREAPVLPVVNKMDLGGDPERWRKALGDPPERGEGAHPVLPCSFVSALTGEGVDALKGRIVEALCGGGILDGWGDEVLLTNARHIDALRRAHEALGRTQAALEEGVTEELLAFEVGGAVRAMGEISGESVTEEVLDSIFSRFCVGK